MEASKQSIASIFNGNRILEVPFYQRRYVWEEEQWKRFLQDMEFISETEKDYFLGSVILKQRYTNIGSVDYRIIIDGQQRLTTFVLFAKSLCLKTNDNAEFNSKFSVRNKGQKSVALHHSHNDRSSFEKVYALDNDIPFEDENNNIIKCYNYFQKHIDVTKLDIDVLFAHVIFIDIDLQPNDEEQTIFDTINSLGMRLTTAELLKNYFFSESTLNDFNNLWKPVFEKDEATINYWDSQITLGRSKRSNIEIFFSAFLNIKIQDQSLSVSAEHKTFFRRANNLFGNYKDFIESYKLDKIILIREIIEYAQIYKDNFKIDTVSETLTGKCGMERLNFIINVLDSSTIIPYVLYVLKNVADRQEVNEIFNYLESYIMRRQICKSSNNSFSDLFTENLVGNSILCFEKLKDYINAKEESATLAYPSDELVVQSIQNEEYSNKKALVILYMIESRIREEKNYATKLYPYDEYTLEHIMPISFEKNWPLTDEFDENERKHLIRTLGNMAMIPHRLNAAISNANWQTKKKGKTQEKGLQHLASGIETLKEVIKCDEWNERQILSRSNRLAEIVIRIWPSFDGSAPVVSHTPNRNFTQYSLDGGPFTSKSTFVLNLVNAYVRKHPSATYAQIKDKFNDGLCAKGFRFIGFLCTETEYNDWQNSSKEKRYKPCNRPNGILQSADGTIFYVSTQWTKEAMGPIIKLAEKEGFIVHESDE